MNRGTHGLKKPTDHVACNIVVEITSESYITVEISIKPRVGQRSKSKLMQYLIWRVFHKIDGPKSITNERRYQELSAFPLPAHPLEMALVPA